MKPPQLLEPALRLLCAVPCAAMVALTFVDVFARYVFAAPLRGSLELVEFCMALIIFAALPLVTRHGGHVTVVLFATAGSAALRRLRWVLCDAMSLLALVLVSWRLWVHAADSAQSGTRTMVLGLPEAPLVHAMAALGAISAMAVLASLIGHLRGSRP
jgi:TRAP-type C4-dicarboxylate transport system, small permease component